MKRDKGYKLPATIDPGQAVCIQVLVPSDPLYIAAFWQSYEFLSKWLAWEESGTNNAKAAADVWRPYFYEARDRWLLGEGSCNVVEPGANEDGEAYYLDILWGIKTVIEWVNQWLWDGKTSAEIKALLAYLAPYIPGINELVDSMAAESAEDRQAAIDAFDWQALAMESWCEDICDLQGWTGALGFLNWVECCIQKILLIVSEQVDLVSHWIDDALTSVSIASGISVLANIVPGGGELFGFDPFVCPWHVTFDFTSGAQGWENFTGFGQEWVCGQWAAGGWVPTNIEPDVMRRGISIAIGPFTDSVITQVKFTFDITWGSGGGSMWWNRLWLDGSYLDEAVEAYMFVENGEDRVWDLDWGYGPTRDTVELFATCSKGDWTGTITLTKAEIWGTGDNPFD